MTELILPLLLIAASGSTVIPIQMQADLIDAQHVSIMAQAPQPGQVLENKDPAHPKLWFYPVAAESKDGRARVWYQRVDSGETEYSDKRTLCLGELTGTIWSRCVLHPESPAWGGPNNVCMRRSPYKPTWGGFNVFQMVHEGNVYRMLYWDQPSESGKAGAMLAESNDGVTWKSASEGTVFTEYNDAFTLIRHKQEYLLYQTTLEDWPDKPYSDNLDKKRRVITLRHSPDLKTWSEQQVILRPDNQDKPETEFYLMKAFPYGSRYFGLLMKYYADPALPGKHSGIIVNELMISEDGLQWERPYRSTDIGFWTYADPIIQDGKLLFFIWNTESMSTVVYPADRLTAVQAGETPGSFMTRPFVCSSMQFTINADVQSGWLRISLMDDQGVPIPAVEAVKIEHTEGSAIPVCFTQKTSFTTPQKSVRLRCELQQAKLFAISNSNP